jgi:hypothetical protein
MQGLILHTKEFGKTYPTFSLDNYEIAGTYDADITNINDFLEAAYEATNSIDYHWSENEGITVLGDYSKRSTSVGDIVWIEDRIYEVSNFGFKFLRRTN